MSEQKKETFSVAYYPKVENNLTKKIKPKKAVLNENSHFLRL